MLDTGCWTPTGCWVLGDGGGGGGEGGCGGSGWDCWDLRIRLSYFNAAQGALMAPCASRRAAMLDRSNGESSLGCAMIFISKNHELTQRGKAATKVKWVKWVK